MRDKVESFQQSLMQHGASNDRVYLMKVAPQDCPEIIKYAEKKAISNNYSKIFAKVPESCRHYFEKKGYLTEAKVPNLFDKGEDGYFFSKFMTSEREEELQADTVAKVIETATNKCSERADQSQLQAGLHWRIMQKDDVHDMARLYSQVFPSYPFPVDDPEYLTATMDQNIVYHGILAGDALVALSSAEIDFQNKHVEMTDFATRSDYRGQGLATFLLNEMEADVSNSGIRTAFTIARAYSFGMNITFARQGYLFSGTLINNTQISGQLESMNVWHKTLRNITEEEF